MSIIKAGMVACSNGIRPEAGPGIRRLTEVLEKSGCQVVQSPYIYGKNGPFSGTGQERARALMDMYRDPEIREIYDISGGDMANEVLDDLDYEVIRESPATFWGYSDLTTVINAIYTMTGKASVLYQIRNLTGSFEKIQQQRYMDRKELFHLDYKMIRGTSMDGIVVGGNIRCFLKLAGTRYFPLLTGRILLLEALGGEVPQMVTYLNQLKQLGAFEQVSGILLGTFSVMDGSLCQPDIETLVKMYGGDQVPVARTLEIGHGEDAKAIIIGKKYSF